MLVIQFASPMWATRMQLLEPLSAAGQESRPSRNCVLSVADTGVQPGRYEIGYKHLSSYTKHRPLEERTLSLIFNFKFNFSKKIRILEKF